MATKTRNDRITGPLFWQGNYGSKGGLLNSNSYSYSDTVTWPDNNIKGWRQLIKQHANATTTGSGSKHDVEKYPYVRGYATANGGSTWTRIYGNADPACPRASTGFIATGRADLNARMKFLQKYRSITRSFQGGVFLGELRETLHMIKRPASAFRNGLDLYHGAVKERLRRAKNEKTRRKVVSGTWLEYVFGWQPLINDIDGAMKALAETVCGKYYGDIISATGYDDNQLVVVNQNSVYGGDAFTLVPKYRTEGEATVRYKGYVGMKSESPWQVAQYNWGVSLSDILPTIWELIPYSFLVDYFTNIGDVIDGMSCGTVTLGWGCKTTRKVSTVKLVGFRSITNSGWSGSADAALGTVSQVSSFQREQSGAVSVGVMDTRLQIPDFMSRKWLNIAALASLRV